MREMIFGLDIGTRTIIGVVGYEEDGKFHVVASKMIPHESRAMIDGQIHDINKVAKTAKQVKEELEQITNMTFKKVAIAAAGRSLKTYNMSAEQILDEKNDVLIESDMIKSLEIEALNKAQLELVKELSEEDKYFCVGYSVIHYYLNGFNITNLEGHKGKKIGVELVATFLPQIVVDSLYSVVERIGLEVGSLTLEPIAAINVVIPENIRLLNLALVDVGAGTSDIAVTKEGSVSAYGMIPVAGDEITEKLVHNYLIDFETAERIKQLIGTQEEIEFQDILGIEQKVTSKEILEVIEPTIEKLTSEIAAKICALNGGKSASAVFCVGGGSQIHGFVEKIAKKLDIDEKRVTLKGSEALGNIVFEDDNKLEGTMFVTPIGICVTASYNMGYEFIYVSVNGEIVELMKGNQLTLVDAVLAKGFDHNNLINRKGENLLFRLNGSIKKISGEFGMPAELYVNNEIASLETPIKADDSIKVVPAVNGKNAQAFVKDFIKNSDIKTVYIDGNKTELKPFAVVNGVFCDENKEILNDDEVYIYEVNTFKDLCQYMDTDFSNQVVYVDGEYAKENTQINNGAQIEIKELNKSKSKIEVKSEEKIKEPEIKEIAVTNEETYSIDKIVTEEILPKREMTESDKFINSVMTNPSELQVIVNNKPVILNKKSSGNYVFIDIFDYIDFDLSKPQGLIVLLINGHKASYTEPLKSGDVIEIRWE